MPPPSSGGVALVEMLNILEGYDLDGDAASARPRTVHLLAEAMRRAFADRARYLGDPDFNPQMPVAAADLEGVRGASCARPSTRTARRSLVADSFAWPARERTRRRTSRWSTRRATRCR